jgi:FdhE protein
MIAADALHGLKRQRPEWHPWLAVIEEILRDRGNSAWAAAVPMNLRPQHATVPLLAGAAIDPPSSAIRRLLDRLIRVAALGGTPKMATLHASLQPELDPIAVFTAALCQDAERVDDTASRTGADPEAWQAVVALLPVPFLQACNRRWARSLSPSWVEGYCPVCASWPAFAEVRGIERSRYFRCGRCGAEWRTHALSCPYCATNDHRELDALVPEKGGCQAVIEACTRCRGYVKTFTRLQGCAPEAVMLEDLGSVDLDVAALEQGFTRPAGAGYPLGITVSSAGSTRRFFGWHA